MASDIAPLVRQRVAERAGFRCEYCLIREEDAGYPHQVDHILSRKHGGDSSLDNLAYACVLCNRHKGSDIATLDPESGQAVALFHPRRDLWKQHLRMRGIRRRLEGRSATGRATIRILRLNALERLAERAEIAALR